MHAAKPPINIMVIGLIKDPWMILSFLGMSVYITAQWIATHINPVITMIAGLLGLVMLFLGIIEKCISIRKSLHHKSNK